MKIIIAVMMCLMFVGQPIVEAHGFLHHLLKPLVERVKTKLHGGHHHKYNELGRLLHRHRHEDPSYETGEYYPAQQSEYQDRVDIDNVIGLSKREKRMLKKMGVKSIYKGQKRR